MSDHRETMRFLFTGGGTGGHLFPAVAAAEELLRRWPQAQVMFIGTRRKMDTETLARYGFRIEGIHCYGLKGKKLQDLAKAVAALPIAFIQALRLIRSFQPDIVVGVGGYVTGPVMLAARVMRKKTVIHEQNAIPGLANRKLAGMVDHICISLPRSADFFPAGKVVLTGNPVRRPLREQAEKQEPPHARDTKTVAVLGGSQGAHRLNELVCEAISQRGIGESVRIIHQTGAADCATVRRRYRDAGVNGDVAPFFTDMAAVYSQADLVISRAGATTLAELAVLGKPAILVPYPYAADDHQRENGSYYVEGGGCLMFSEDELSGDRLAEEIDRILGDDALRARMTASMRRLGRPDAAEKIADVCVAAAA